MSTVRALVLRSAGTNCDAEAVHALRKAGAAPDLVHLHELIESPQRLQPYGIVVFPGGFSYGDDIASGAVYAVEMRRGLLPALRAHVADGALALGICNGFQILVRAGLLPDTCGSGVPEATLLWNESNQFECRWVRLEATTDRCAFLQRGQVIDCPVAHGEGRFVVADASVRERMIANGQLALRYVDPSRDAGPPAAYPWNPNGSPDGIAGVCDTTGRVLGLMPHPERNIESWHHPRWTRGEGGEATGGLAVFRNAVRAASQRG
ncbi:MAG: phosphoribosylformylglycinamidine synthase I [Planctomycetes bacterium]|nr:phosphoribosylformylglycinamidine synthase I [Planctomycetota bacterium]